MPQDGNGAAPHDLVWSCLASCCTRMKRLGLLKFGRKPHRTPLSAIAKNAKIFAVLIMMLVSCSRMSKAWRTLVSSRDGKLKLCTHARTDRRTCTLAWKSRSLACWGQSPVPANAEFYSVFVVASGLRSKTYESSRTTGWLALPPEEVTASTMQMRKSDDKL